jgi:excinuclease UvrABC nuclease subunit
MGSLKKLKEAPLEEIRSVPGIGNELASAIYNHFHGPN